MSAAEAERAELATVKIIDSSEEEEYGDEEPGEGDGWWGAGSAPAPGEEDDGTKEFIVPDLVDCKGPNQYYDIEEECSSYFIEVPPEAPARAQPDLTPSPNWPVLEINPMDNSQHQTLDTDASTYQTIEKRIKRKMKPVIFAEMVYSCAKCDKSFKELGDLTQHISSHKGVKKVTRRTKMDAKERKLRDLKRKQRQRARARRLMESGDWD